MLLEYIHDGYPQLAITFVEPRGDKIECCGDIVTMHFYSDEYYGYALPFPLRVPYYPAPVLFGFYEDPVEVGLDGKLYTYKNSQSYMACPFRDVPNMLETYKEKKLVGYPLPCPAYEASAFSMICVVNCPDNFNHNTAIIRPCKFGGDQSIIYDFPELHKREGKRNLIGNQTYMPMLVDKFWGLDYEHSNCLCYSIDRREVIRCVYPNAIYLAKLPSRMSIIDKFVDERSDRSVAKRRKILDVSSSDSDQAELFYTQTKKIYKNLKENATTVMTWKNLEARPYPKKINFTPDSKDFETLYEPLSKLDLERSREEIEEATRNLDPKSDGWALFERICDIARCLKYDESGNLVKDDFNRYSYYEFKQLERKLNLFKKIISCDTPADSEGEGVASNDEL